MTAAAPATCRKAAVNPIPKTAPARAVPRSQTLLVGVLHNGGLQVDDRSADVPEVQAGRQQHLHQLHPRLLQARLYGVTHSPSPAVCSTSPRYRSNVEVHRAARRPIGAEIQPSGRGGRLLRRRDGTDRAADLGRAGSVSPPRAPLILG